MTVTKGLFVRLHAKPDQAEAVAALLESARPLAMAENATRAWFAFRFGPTEFGIYDCFADDAGRDAHLNGAIAKALMENADKLLAQPPVIEKIDVLSAKL